jgi:pilus assembly protein Flp/PilA
MKIQNLRRRRRGAALVEYGLIVAGVTLVTAAAVAIFGHKTNDLIAAAASILPGAHADDNGPMFSGKIIETTAATTDGARLDIAGIAANTGTERLGVNLTGDTAGGGISSMIIE